MMEMSREFAIIYIYIYSQILADGQQKAIFFKIKVSEFSIRIQTN